MGRLSCSAQFAERCCALLLVVLLSLQPAARSQMVSSFVIQVGVGPNRETYLDTGDGTRIVALTGPSTNVICPSQRTSVIYTPGSPMGTVTIRGIGTQTIPVKRYLQFLGQTLEIFTNSPPTSPAQNVQGCLYHDDCNAFFTTSSNVIESISRGRPFFPVPLVDIMLVRRMEMLQINVDPTPDGVPTVEDDRANLRGAEDFELGQGDSIAYSNEVATFFQGSSPQRQISNVREIHILDSENGAGSVGTISMTFRGNSANIITGPGRVYVAVNSANERVICFIKSANVSEEIGLSLVRMQINASSSGILRNGFSGESLINLRSSQEIPYQTAQRIEYKNGIINVYDGTGTLIRPFGSTATPITLSTFFNNQVETVDSSQCRNFTVPSGGVNLFYNAQDNTMFAYSAANRFVLPSIQLALQAINSTSSSTATNNMRVIVDDLNRGTLELNGVRILRPTNSRATPLPAGATVTMPSRDALEFSRNGVLLMRPIKSISMTTIATGPTVGTVFMPQVGQTVALSRGGTVMRDAIGNMLVASPSSGLSMFVSSRTQAISRLKASVRTSTGNNMWPRISVVANGRSIFDGTNPDILETTSNQRIVYLNGSVNAATATSVPIMAQVRYVMSVQEVRIEDRMIGSVILQTRLNGPFLTPRFLATTANIEPLTSDAVLEGGGVFYLGKDGAAYLPSDLIDETSLQALNQVRALDKCIENVLGVSVLDDGRLRLFSDGAFQSLRGSGTSFIVGPEMFHTTDLDLAQSIISANSRAFPLQLDCNDKGQVVISRSGIVIFSFDLSSPTFNVGENDVIEFDADSDVLSGPAVFSGTFSPVSSLVMYNGVANVSVESSMNISGRGLLIVDVSSPTSFFTSDSLSAARIDEFLRTKVDVFVPPRIEEILPVSIASSRSEVDARFGQIVTVPIGSTVNLKCVASVANPQADFAFFLRNFTDGSMFTALLSTAPGVEMRRDGANEYTLQISDVSAGEVEYRCDATNILGTATAFSRIIGVRGRPPEIQNQFLTPVTGPGSLAVTARTDRLPTITPIIDNSDVDDRSRITNRVLIGCRAKGRGTPVITWTTEPARVLNFSSPSLNESRPGRGQSILSVALEPDDVQCVTYICSATNGLGSDVGSARVCPQRFEQLSSSRMSSNCSVDCGIGIREVFFDYTRIFDGGQETVLFDNVPVGFVRPGFTFCVEAPCPEVTFQFEVSNYTDCSRFCNAGRQSRNVTCVRVTGSERVVLSEDKCLSRGIAKPPSMIECNAFPCPEYMVTPFGPCSRTCRGGVMVRNVSCEMVILDEDDMFDLDNTTVVDMTLCERYSRQERPVEVVSCRENIPCPVRFLPSQFGPVKSLSAAGECDQFNCQARTFTCVTFSPFNPLEVWPTDDDVCLDQGLQRIQSVRSCGGRPCNFGRWNSTALGVCSAVCGIGLQSFNVVCLNRTTDEVIDNGYCNGNLRPRDIDVCFVRNCPGNCVREPRDCKIIALFQTL